MYLLGIITSAFLSTVKKPTFYSNDIFGINVKLSHDSLINSTHVQQQQWRASFQVSKRTQARIIDAGKTDADAIDRAILVLQTLLRYTSPLDCNESNVVCALTTTAKMMTEDEPHETKKRPWRENQHIESTSAKQTLLRSLLFDTISTAYTLMSENRMSNRQLSNVLWAIAKHYRRDSMLLPLVDINYVEVEEDYHRRKTFISKAERLNLSSRSTSSMNIVVAKTVDEIGKRLSRAITASKTLNSTHVDAYSNFKANDEIRGRMKMVEIIMSVSAFAILLQQDIIPPNWSMPSRILRTHEPDSTSFANSSKINRDYITFEQRNELHSVSKKKSSSTMSPINDSVHLITRNGLDAGLIATFYDSTADYIVHQNKILENIPWKDLVNLLWSFVHRQGMTRKSESLVVALAQEITHRINTTNHAHDMATPKPRDLALVAWALGVLHCNYASLTTPLIHYIQALSEYLVSRRRRSNNSLFQDWKSPDLVQLAVGLAHGRLDRKELLIPMFYEMHRSLNGTVGEVVRTFSTTELTTLLWVQARLHLIDLAYQPFLDLATSTLTRRVCQQRPVMAYLDPQQQANLAWSLVVLEKFSSEAVTLLTSIFESYSLMYSQGKNFNVEHAHQLWQAYSILEHECPCVVGCASSDFIDCLRQRWRKEKWRLKTSSERHMALSKTLDLMGVAHINEHDEDIDVAIILKAGSRWTQTAEILGETTLDDHFHRVAVEFDGPNHFVRPLNGIKLGPKECPRPLGHTVLKYRLLKYQGWFVVRVPYYEYDKIPFWASMEKQRYLQRLLKTEAKRYFSSVDVSDYKAIAPNRQSRFD